MSADQARQLEKMAALERSSQEQSRKVSLLEARVEALEQDNSALKDKASKLQEKVKAAAKEKKRYSFPSLMLVLRVFFFCAYALLALAELKSL